MNSRRYHMQVLFLDKDGLFVDGVKAVASADGPISAHLDWRCISKIVSRIKKDAKTKGFSTDNCRVLLFCTEDSLPAD